MQNELLLPRELCCAGTSNTGFSRASKQDLSILTGHEDYRHRNSIQIFTERYSALHRLLGLIVPRFFDSSGGRVGRVLTDSTGSRVTLLVARQGRGGREKGLARR